jgi:hypothetical protein
MAVGTRWRMAHISPPLWKADANDRDLSLAVRGAISPLVIFPGIDAKQSTPTRYCDVSCVMRFITIEWFECCRHFYKGLHQLGNSLKMIALANIASLATSKENAFSVSKIIYN